MLQNLSGEGMEENMLTLKVSGHEFQSGLVEATLVSLRAYDK